MSTRKTGVSLIFSAILLATGFATTAALADESAPGALPELTQAMKDCGNSASKPADVVVRVSRSTDKRRNWDNGKFELIHFDGNGVSIGALKRDDDVSNYEIPYSEERTAPGGALSVRGIATGRLNPQNPTANCVRSLTQFAIRSELESAPRAKTESQHAAAESNRTESGHPEMLATAPATTSTVPSPPPPPPPAPASTAPGATASRAL